MNGDENFRKVSVKIPESFRKLFMYFFTFMKHI
jgi:hypothetical protein